MKHLYLTRKVLCALFLFLLTVGSAWAQHSTPTIDGTIDVAAEYSGNNYYSGDARWSITWNSQNVFFAIEGVDVDIAAVVYIDSDPLPLVNGGDPTNGNLTGQNYDGTNANLPFRADRAIYFKNTYQEIRNAVNGNWDLAVAGDQSIGPNTYAQREGSKREIAIPWSKINKDGSSAPRPFNWLGYLTNKNNDAHARGAVPVGNPAFGNSSGNAYTNLIDFVRYFTISNVTSGNVNDQGPGTGLAFAYNSYTHMGGDISGFNSINVYDFTMNSPGRTITRDANSGDWKIDGSLKVGAGTINLAGARNPIIVGKDFIVYKGASFDAGSNAPLTVADDFVVKGAFVSASSLTLKAAGDTIRVPDNTFSVAKLFLEGGNRVLTNNLTITSKLELNYGAVLNTGRSMDTNSENTIFLTSNSSGSPASLSEQNGGYVLGNISANSTINTDGTSNFGGIGLSLVNRAGTVVGAANPGLVTVRRITGKVIGSRGIEKSISRQFQVASATDNALVLDLQFDYYDGSGNTPNELNGNTEANLKLFKALSSTSLYQRIPNSEADPNRNVVSARLSSLSGFYTISESNIPLPVELVAFTGKLEGSAVRLSWATASEKNNKGFEVQRQTGSDKWYTLGFVAGHGSTTQRNAYSYLDANASEGTTRYRLRQLDNDGTESYSTVVTLQVPAGNAPALVLSPVPAADVLTISGLGAGSHVAEVYDMMGKRVLSHSFSSTQSTVSVANLPSGLYVVQVQGKKSKFVKQ